MSLACACDGNGVPASDMEDRPRDRDDTCGRAEEDNSQKKIIQCCMFTLVEEEGGGEKFITSGS